MMLNLRSTAGRRERHRAADRAALLAAAEAVFSQRGYHGTSMRDLARAAGFSVGGVYQCFPSKDDLYLALIEEQWQQFFALLRQALAAGDTIERLLALTRATLEYFEARRAFFQIYLSDRSRFAPAFKDRVAATVTHNQRTLRRFVARLMAEGVRERILRPLDPEVLASAYLGILHHSLFDLACGALAKRAVPRAELLVSLFLCGAARPGSRACHRIA
jgi:AcrR family transcriptional regulator